jgi:hypothetical protein
LQKLGKLPPAVHQPHLPSTIAALPEKIIEFNTEKQQLEQVKIIAWIQIPRHGYNRSKPFEIQLRRQFATKYITVAMLECENYL